ncbi:inner membrane protein YpjD [Moritella sp. F3]|uniref:cytochrome C assembly family protein n=1 Tax=Moritella sp. F3 TaxID=2718882 RepID=UPI0018E1C1B2|nr:cytochrome c biogenesis protein CcsA [Moritella sp. F3]GIC77923.1 inner membrane protein YpjD [Moritella sp. F1]GIC82388.1 inner membrane protein YpjD [Moritella sp. F3]
MELFALGAIIFYIAATYYCIKALTVTQQPSIRTIFILGASATLCHLFWMGFDIVTTAGINLSIINVAALISLLISMIMTMSVNKFKILPLLPIVYGFSIVVIAISYLLPTIYISNLSHNTPLVIHIVVILFAYAAFIVASLLALQMAYLDYQLKHKRPIAMHPALPSLMTIEKQLIRLLSVGLVLLSIAILTSFIFFEDAFTHTQAHKTVLSILAWLFYSVLLWGHFKQGWRSNKIAFGTLFGSILLSLAYFGSRFVKEIILK